MKILVFDTSAVISLSLNSLVWVLNPLKKYFKGSFYIPNGVKRELVDIPIQGKKFKLEAIAISGMIKEGIIEVYEKGGSDGLLDLVNSIYVSKENKEAKNPGGKIKILHKGEVEAILAAVKLKADAFVVDERTTRLLLEDPERLRELLEKKLHTGVSINYESLNKFKLQVGKINIIRSTELMMIAFEKGLLKEYNASNKDLVDAILWGLRLRGCSISGDEVEELIKIESKV